MGAPRTSVLGPRSRGRGGSRSRGSTLERSEVSATPAAAPRAEAQAPRRSRDRARRRAWALPLADHRTAVIFLCFATAQGSIL
eukprot:6771315-Prymnesium_polylepis.1